MPSNDAWVLDGLAEQAAGLGADSLEVEYKDGHEEVMAMRGAVGVGIGRFRSDSSTAAQLRIELDALASRKRRVTLAGRQFEMRAREFESFGETAYSVELRRVEQADAADEARPRRSGRRGPRS
jgi:hypothetical protein